MEIRLTKREALILDYLLWKRVKELNVLLSDNRKQIKEYENQNVSYFNICLNLDKCIQSQMSELEDLREKAGIKV